MKRWVRLGVAISVTWLLAVALMAAFEWFYTPEYRLLTETVFVESSDHEGLQGIDYWNAIEEHPSINWTNIFAISFLPIAGLWIVGLLAGWVRAGFGRSEP